MHSKIRYILIAVIILGTSCKKKIQVNNYQNEETIFLNQFTGNYYGTYYTFHTDSPFIRNKPTMVVIEIDSTSKPTDFLVFKSEGWILPIALANENSGKFSVDYFKSSSVNFGKDSGLYAEIYGTPNNLKLFWWDCPSGPK